MDKGLEQNCAALYQLDQRRSLTLTPRKRAPVQEAPPARQPPRSSSVRQPLAPSPR